MKILYVCSMGKYRSRTAAICTKAAWNDIRFGGTDKDAEIRITPEDIIWADVIVCMESSHRNKIRRKVKGISTKIQVWNIPDIYGLLDDELCHLVKRKFEDLVEPLYTKHDNNKSNNQT